MVLEGALRRQLVELITSERRRRRQTRDPRPGRRLEAHLSWRQKALSALATDLDAVRGTPARRAAEDRLASVPGIGKTSARTLIAEPPALGRLDRCQIAALAGGAPIDRASGACRERRGPSGASKSLSLSVLPSPAMPRMLVDPDRIVGRVLTARTVAQVAAAGLGRGTF